MQVEAAPTAAIGTDRCDLSQGSGSSLRPSKAVHRNPTWECDWEPGASFPEASECHGRFCPALSVAPTPASMSSPGLRAVASRTTQRHPRPARCPTTCHEAICPRFHKLLRPGFSRAPVPIHLRDLRGTPLRPVGRNAGARRGYTVTALDVASSAHVPPVHASQSAALSARYVHLASSRLPASFVQHITSRIACQGAPTRPTSPAHGSAPPSPRCCSTSSETSGIICPVGPRASRLASRASPPRPSRSRLARPVSSAQPSRASLLDGRRRGR